MLPKHPLGRDIAGTEESTSRLARDDGLEYLVPITNDPAVSANPGSPEVLRRLELSTLFPERVTSIVAPGVGPPRTL